MPAQQFRENRQKVYPDHSHLIDQVLQEKALDLVTARPDAEQITPTPYSEYKESVPKNETSPVTLTTQSCADEKAPKPKRSGKQKYGKRQAKKEAVKEAIVVWLNDLDQHNQGFRVTEIIEKMTDGGVKERMFRIYLVELFAAKKIKCWVKSVRLDGGKVIRHHYYAGAKIKNPYYKWVDD
jgi:hypothetical protein